MEYSANVHEIEHEGKRIVLVGTAHISRESVEEVSRVIEQEHPMRCALNFVLLATKRSAMEIAGRRWISSRSFDRAKQCYCWQIS